MGDLWGQVTVPALRGSQTQGRDRQMSKQSHFSLVGAVPLTLSVRKDLM